MARPTPSPEQASPPLPPQTTLFTLKNGLRVVIQEDHFAPVVAIQVWVQVGSADEDPPDAGVAHVHEHMLFKGTERRGVGEIAAEVESSGGHINAFTDWDRTVYHLVLASRHFVTGLDILADAVSHSAFDPAELERERKVVLEEWKRAEDTPSTRAYNRLFALAFQRHPYGRPVIGSRQTIARLTRDRVVDFYHHWYRPNNMVLAIAGDVDPEVARAEVTRLFGPLRRGALPHRPRTPEPAQEELRVAVESMEVQESHLYLGFHIPPATHPDSIPLDVLSYILGGGESARLVHRVKAEQELVNTIGAYAYTLVDSGLFLIAASLERDKAAAALDSILTETSRVCRELPSTEELQRARANLKSSFIYRKETVQGRSRELGYFLSVFDDVNYETTYLKRLASVTREDLRRVARLYLRPENLSLVFVGPPGPPPLPQRPDLVKRAHELEADCKPSAAAAETAAGSEAVHFQRLGNGVRLVVKEHHEVHLFSIRAAMLGGVLFEDAADNGINNFLTDLLTRGTEHYSRQGLASAVDSLAGSIDGISGRSSLGLSGTFPSEQLDKAIDLFLEVLLHPTFPPKEVEKRRREVLLAIKNQEDDLAHLAVDLFYETLFQDHPYRLPVLGRRETIRALRRRELAAYYHRLLAPEQLVIAVVGDVETAEVTRRLTDALAGLPGTAAETVLPAPEAPPSTIRRAEKKLPDKQQSHIVLGFQGVRVTDHDRYALKVLEAVLSQQGGRLFYRLREQQALAYAVTAFSAEGVAPGVFGVYIATDPGRVPAAISGILDELGRLREEPVAAEELSRAKKYLVGSYEISQQTNAAQAEELALNELYGLGIRGGRDYIAGIRGVTAADVQRAARAYLRLDAYTLAVIAPQPDSPTAGR